MRVKTILFTTENIPDMPDFDVRDTVKGVLLDMYECIIFHSSTDTLATTITLLRNAFNEKQYNLIYINKELNPILYCIFKTYDADIYDSDEYIQDEGVLSYFVEEYGKTGMELRGATKDLKTIEKSVMELEKASTPQEVEKLLRNDYWVLNLKTAFQELEKMIHRETKVQEGVTDGLAEVLEDTVERQTEQSSKIIQLEMAINQLKLEKKQLQDSLNTKTMQDKRPNSPFIFPTYNVPLHIDNVLYVKEYSPCRYLNTFLLHYKGYLEKTKQLKVTILYVIPNLKNVTSKYISYASRLATDTIDVIDMNGSDTFVTYEPTPKVMNAFFSRKADVHIVLDLLYGDNIIKGHMVKEYGAIGSGKDISRYNITSKRCFIPILKVEGMINIPHILKYINKSWATQQSLYFEKCKGGYDLLDAELFKNGTNSR